MNSTTLTLIGLERRYGLSHDEAARVAACGLTLAQIDDLDARDLSSPAEADVILEEVAAKLAPATPTLSDTRAAVCVAQKVLPRMARIYNTGHLEPPATKVIGGVVVERPLSRREALDEAHQRARHIERSEAKPYAEALRLVYVRFPELHRATIEGEIF